MSTALPPAGLPETLRTAFGEGLVAGAALGFVETLLVYATGYAPPDEALLIVGFDLVLGALAGAGLGLLGLFRLRVGAGSRQLALLLTPVILFLVRGNVDPNQVDYSWAPLVRWGLSALTTVMLVAVCVGSQQRRSTGLPAPLFATCCVLSQLVLGAAFAVRTIDLVATRGVMLGDPAARVGLSVVTVGVALWLGRRIASGERRLLRRSALVALMFAGLSALLGGALGAHRPVLDSDGLAVAAAAKKPNVLLIVLDTVRRDHVSAYGSARATTPNLDHFASGALLFENAYAAATYSLSSHASLLTGLLPSQHGAHPVPFRGAQAERGRLGNSGHFAVSDHVTTLAEELRDQGYLTAGITANDVFLAEWTGLRRGFSHYACQARRSYRYVPSVRPLLARLGRGAARRFPYHEPWPANTVTDAAETWLAGTQGQPFFLFLNYFDAHDPYLAPPPFDTRFPRVVPGADERTGYLLSQYDGAIGFIDAEVSRLLDWLRERRLLDDTMVIVTADHGEFFGEHALWHHASYLYEEVIQVPLIVKLPHQRQGLRFAPRLGLQEVRGLVQGVLKGTTEPEALLQHLDRGAEPIVIAESWLSARPGGPALPARAVYAGHYKLIQRLGVPSELYDLTADPLERRDLIGSDTPTATALLASINGALPPLQREAAAVGEVRNIDPEARERMRALGYLSP
jgi:hypothetical protein